MLNLSLTLVKPYPQEIDQAIWQALFDAWVKVCKPTFGGEIIVSFLSRPEMMDLHWRALKVSKVTDVLSFRYYEQINQDAAAGEIFICPAEARVCAYKLATTYQLELSTLFVHGLIHLTDLDHASKSEQNIFDRLTGQIMATQKLAMVSLWSA